MFTSTGSVVASNSGTLLTHTLSCTSSSLSYTSPAYTSTSGAIGGGFFATLTNGQSYYASLQAACNLTGSSSSASGSTLGECSFDGYPTGNYVALTQVMIT